MGSALNFYDYYPLLLLVTEGIYQQHKLSLLIMIVKGENKIVDVEIYLDLENSLDGTATILSNKNVLGEAAIFAFNSYEYAEPLYFVELPKISAYQKITLLAMFDTWYGDTDQETTKWALEYQLLTRMLVKENALILNPKYLELDLDLLEKIKNIIWV